MALSKRLINQYNRLYRKWERRHRQYWKRAAMEPFITGYGQQHMTVAQASLTDPKERRGYGAIGKPRRPDPSTFRTDKDLRRAIAAMKREVSPDFERRRAVEMRKSSQSAADILGLEELSRKIGTLSNEQLLHLNDYTDFSSEIWQMAYPPKGVSAEDIMDEVYLDYLVDEITARYPTRAQKRAEKSRQRQSKKRLAQRQKKWSAQESERERRNIELAKKGEQWLKSYGVPVTFGEGPNWWKRYL